MFGRIIAKRREWFTVDVYVNVNAATGPLFRHRTKAVSP
jgi:hypothetical protein